MVRLGDTGNCPRCGRNICEVASITGGFYSFEPDKWWGIIKETTHYCNDCGPIIHQEYLKQIPSFRDRHPQLEAYTTPCYCRHCGELVCHSRRDFNFGFDVLCLDCSVIEHEKSGEFHIKLPKI